MATVQTDEEIRDEVKYFDTLYDFASIIMRLNENAFNGETKQNMEKKICRLIPAFTLLCGADEDGNAIEHKRNPSKGGRPKKAPKPKTMLQSNLTVYDGWGMCPNCGGKCIKVNKDTILVNHPAFCKKCHTESIVTWRYEEK